LYEQALKLIPGAILGIRRPYNFVPGEYPIFFEKAKGGRVTDVDGNDYVDMLCAYGPIIIGHREEEIDNAVIEKMRNDGFCFSLTQPIQNELAEKMIQKHRGYVDEIKKLAEARQIRCTGLVREGEAHQVIRTLAQEQQASLIVMGSHGRTGIRRLLMGSVTERVICCSGYPVLVVKV